MIHNLFWQKWQGHGPFENLVKDTAIDSVVLAALQPIFLPGGRAEFSRRRSLPPPPVASPSPRGLADCAETHQTPLVRAWILEGEGKAWGPRQSGESESTAVSSMQGGWGSRVMAGSQQGLASWGCCVRGLSELALWAQALGTKYFFHFSEWSWCPLLAIKNSNWETPDLSLGKHIQACIHFL